MTRTAFALLLCSAALAADPKLPDGAVAKVGAVRREALVISPDGKTVAVRVPKGFDLIDLGTGKAVPLRDDTGKRFLPENENRDSGDSSLAFFPDGKTVATANQQPCVSVWDAATGKHLRDVPTPNAGKHDNEGKPTDERYAAGPVYCSPHFKGVVMECGPMYLLGQKDEWQRVAIHAQGHRTHATSNGRWFSAVDIQASVECWFFSIEPKLSDPKEGDKSEEFSGRVAYNRYTHIAATSEDGLLVAAWSTGDDGKGKEISGLGLVSRRAKKEEKTHELTESGGKEFDAVKALGFSGDSKRLFAATEEKVAVWDTATGKRGKDVKLPAKVSTVVFDPPRDRAFVLGGGFLSVVELR